MKNKNFNLVIVGVGGQGQITLLKILTQAAFFENFDVKTSELHGLSQRGGSVEVHLRFGKNIFSPLVSQAGADLILALEFQEAPRALYYASSKTKFLINKHSLLIPGESLIPENEILNGIKKFTQHHFERNEYQKTKISSIGKNKLQNGAGFTKNIEVVEAAEICKKELQKEVFAGVYLLSFASFKKLIPLKPTSILKAIKNIIPAKYLELNLKTFELAKRA